MKIKASVNYYSIPHSLQAPAPFKVLLNKIIIIVAYYIYLRNPGIIFFKEKKISICIII